MKAKIDKLDKNLVDSSKSRLLLLALPKVWDLLAAISPPFSLLFSDERKAS